MFEKATRLKVRFDSAQGKLSVEDLWDLPLTSKTNKANLDDVAKAVARSLKSSDNEESFVLKSTPSNNLDKLKLDIVKHVISVCLAENEASDTAAANRAKKQQILTIIANKQDGALAEKSIDELKALAETL